MVAATLGMTDRVKFAWTGPEGLPALARTEGAPNGPLPVVVQPPAVSDREPRAHRARQCSVIGAFSASDRRLVPALIRSVRERSRPSAEQACDRYAHALERLSQVARERSRKAKRLTGRRVLELQLERMQREPMQSVVGTK